jgi:CBS domain-containing membrane protein
MQNVAIHKVMTPAPATVEATASIVAAERLMRERHCHHVPVVHRGRVVGMLGRQDLLKALVLRPQREAADSSPLGHAALQTRHVADVMQHDVEVLTEASTLFDAARVLAAGDFHALPVVTPDGHLIGIVTSTDLVQALAEDLEHAGSSVAAASTGRPGGPEGSDLEARALREVYRAARNYLRSGRAEAEHSRLLQAVEHAREALRTANVDL